jgi:hypothetical protein
MMNGFSEGATTMNGTKKILMTPVTARLSTSLLLVLGRFSRN